MPLQFCHEIDNIHLTKRMEGQRVVNLKELIGQLDSARFRETFSTQEECLQVLANAKWADGFVCRNCGNEKYCQGHTLFSRRCTRCKKDESATAHTIFHHCRMDLPRAFEIAYMVCGTPAMPASEISQVLETRHMTCLNFKKRILQCLQLDGRLIPDLEL
jgi:two-component system, sensor histidine kinase LadS